MLAHQIALQIAAILYMVPFGIALAATVRVGQPVGRRNAVATRRAGFDALIRLIYRHGMRVSEAINLRRTDADLPRHRLTFKRMKHGFSVPHPIDGESVRAIKRYLATRSDTAPWLFLSERRGKLTRQAINYLLIELGRRAGLGHVHPHMLRHACGYALADKGTDFRVMQDYLGHKNPRRTAHYSRTSPARFNKVWD